MATTPYEGTVVIEIDGVEYNVEKFEYTVDTGRKAVKGMNKTGKSDGFTEGVSTIEIKVSVLVPLDIPHPDWGKVDDAVITKSPVSRPEKRTTFTGCYVTKFNGSHSGDKEATVSLDMMAIDMFEE